MNAEHAPTNEPARNTWQTAILKAYLDAPSGQAADAIGKAIGGLKPRPTVREAIELTASLPAITQSQVLAGFSKLPGAFEGNGCADGGLGHYDPCQCPRKPKAKRAGAAGRPKAEPEPEPDSEESEDRKLREMREFSGTAWRVFPTEGRDGFSILFPCGYRTRYGYFDLLGEGIPEEVALLVLDAVSRRMKDPAPIKLHKAVSTRMAFQIAGADAWGKRGVTWWKKLATEESVIRGGSTSTEEYEKAMRKLSRGRHVG